MELGDLEEGEHLWTEDGPVEVQSLHLLSTAESVYNNDVHGHHIYQVGDVGVLVHNTGGVEKYKRVGRSGKQSKLRELGNDPNVSKADRGWIKQELNQIARGKRNSIRLPGSSRNGVSGKVLAHRRGKEARKGHGYKHSDLQEVDLHKLQHKHEGYH